MSTHPELARRLGTVDAVVIGLGSMIGAGVFAAFTPAAQAAGSGLLVGLAVAAFVAYCNATSSAQLAAAYPTSGGTYIYGRERLGPWPGFLAGWGFVVGKTASSAAMAMTFAAYAAPPGWERPVAIAAVVLLVAVNYRGVSRTAGLARIIVAAVLAALTIAVAAVWAGGAASPGDVPGGGLLAHGWYGILQSAGLLFFAFAGYARIATLGEEVKDPRRTIPRTILLALAIAAAVYAIVGVTLLAALGPDGVASTSAPLADAVVAGGWAWAAPVVRVGAALASLGALLALVAGLGRTTLAMAREGDLPHWLAAIHPRFQVPHRAELALGAVICVIIAVADLRGAIAFSSFGVLVYYLVANLAAFTQSGADRRYPKVLQVLGALACVVLVATLPLAAVLVGLVIFAAGAAYRMARLRRRA
ncbi:APA family basic amino acid/polyamine antiporter [Arthrobacter stackebrandtii]|uniref:APA family basic amino acid/polyamine antiporter n=1 Tax=Arthrobacter stackebrandtii TaxID=272161 RepID=A0ABS4YX50_9MICC|nr:APC family permease [Arthrobacter stackebrandtii]MBP2413379.1 APA family basic amino acid/polyamine antiporter [Arthrobacter stackebrandtii]PYG99531.1 amino acid permease [Arthrobacter stackebrandtii]